MEYIYCNGTTANNGSLSFDEVYGAIVLDGQSLEATPTAAVGNITITNTTSETTLITITATANNMGVNTVTSEYAYDREVYATISALAAEEVMLIGYDYAGDENAELITWAASNDILKKQSETIWNRIVYEVCGDINDARTITLDAKPNEDIANGFTNNVGHVTYTVGNQPSGDDTVEIVSDEATDNAKITLIGKNAAGTIFTEEITLTGTTEASSGNDMNYVFGAFISEVGTGTAGAVSIRQADDTVIGVFDTATYNSWGLVEPDEYDVSALVKTPYAFDGRNGLVTITNSNASATDSLILVGEDADGNAQTELLTLVSGTKASTKYWSLINYVAYVDAATTESIRIHNATADDGGLKIGNVIQPASSADSIVEGVFG
jgi:hypothetical protein